jgi:carbon-monoxide dehydrogenase large subunit
VNDALRPLGVKLLRSPISPRRLVDAVLAARRPEGESA